MSERILTNEGDCVKMFAVPAPTPPEEIAARVDRVCSTAMNLFAERGYAATSMAAIAEAAGLSRPALYQHFAGREDVFRAALERILSSANQRALDALHADGSVETKFDGYLQRCRGDVIGPLLASSHGAELLETRLTEAAGVADRLHADRRRALEAFLRQRGAAPSTVKRTTELLELAPIGLKGDQPTITMYRKRLSTLASAAASLVD